MTGPIKHFAIRHWPRLLINLLNPLFYLIVSDSCFIFWAALLRHSDNAFRLFIRILLVDNLGWFQLWINTFPENWRLNNASGKREKICMLTWWFGQLWSQDFFGTYCWNKRGRGRKSTLWLDGLVSAGHPEGVDKSRCLSSPKRLPRGRYWPNVLPPLRLTQSSMYWSKH